MLERIGRQIDGWMGRQVAAGWIGRQVSGLTLMAS